MKRIHVVGTSGSGKTTVSAALSLSLGIPHVELDALHWLPGWVERDDAELRALVGEAVAGDAWVVDGNYGGPVRDLVWSRADTIVWLDLTKAAVMAQVTRRTFERWWTGEVLWGGNRESLRMSLLSRDSILLWAWSTHGRRRAEYGELLRNVPQRVVHLRSRAEVDAWLAGLDPRRRERS